MMIISLNKKIISVFLKLKREENEIK